MRVCVAGWRGEVVPGWGIIFVLLQCVFVFFHLQQSAVQTLQISSIRLLLFIPISELKL